MEKTFLLDPHLGSAWPLPGPLPEDVVPQVHPSRGKALEMRRKSSTTKTLECSLAVWCHEVREDDRPPGAHYSPPDRVAVELLKTTSYLWTLGPAITCIVAGAPLPRPSPSKFTNTLHRSFSPSNHQNTTSDTPKPLRQEPLSTAPNYSSSPPIQHPPPPWSYVAYPAAKRDRLRKGRMSSPNSHTSQVGKLAHYAFDAVISAPPSLPHNTHPAAPNTRRSIRLPRRRPPLHGPHVRPSPPQPATNARLTRVLTVPV